MAASDDEKESLKNERSNLISDNEDSDTDNNDPQTKIKPTNTSSLEAGWYLCKARNPFIFIYNLSFNSLPFPTSPQHSLYPFVFCAIIADASKDAAALIICDCAQMERHVVVPAHDSELLWPLRFKITSIISIGSQSSA